jgi:hypothetical protein
MFAASACFAAACKGAPDEPAPSVPRAESAVEVRGSQAPNKPLTTPPNLASVALTPPIGTSGTPDAAPPMASTASSMKKECPRDPGPVPRLARYTLRVGGKADVSAEFVFKPADTERGLMYRTQMDEGAGMLFKLVHTVHTFWMHNTCIPLDMIFADEAGKIVGILEDVPILNEESRTVHLPSSYVLEVNAGYCKRHGIAVGQNIALPDAVRQQKVP